MKVTSLRTYPVKSLGGKSVDQAAVEPQGLVGDRRWCLVDEDGEVVTARECHSLLRLTAEMLGEHCLQVTDRADGTSLRVHTPQSAAAAPISISQLATATLADSEAGEWISDRVGHRLRLVWQSDPTSRAIATEDGGQPGDVVSLADAGPLLLTAESSLAQLNDWIDSQGKDWDPVEMLRFRPNVVIDGSTPFAEDGWGRVRVGSVDFRTTELCNRCVMTTLDPVTLDRGKEPIRTLAQHRRWDGATWFGIRLTPMGGGTIGVGDAVQPSD